MNMSGMSFNALPPISIPFRFFATAIAFMLVIAAFIFFSGESLWLSRWHPSMLALTHGFTLGFITPIMMGALLQMLPVVGGIGMSNVKSVGRFCYPLHFLGTGLLMLGFVSTHAWQANIKILAIICLGLSFSYYIYSVIYVLKQYFNQQLVKHVFDQNPTIVVIGYSIVALLVTVILGGILQVQGAGFAFSSAFSFDKSYTNLHGLWGGIGWMSLLILAVSLQVIPMFHVAPGFPALSARLLPILLLLSLFIVLVFPHLLMNLLDVILLLLLLFNLILLNVISQRKRKIPDLSINAWRVAACSFVVIVLLYFCPEQWLPQLLINQKNLLLSAAFIYFYLLTIILGMLFKILPFLSYTHLQQQCLVNFEAMAFLPNMHDLLNKKAATLVFYCHISSGIALILTVIRPEFYWLLSSSLMVEFSLFFIMTLQTILVYRRSAVKIEQLTA